MQSKQNLTTKNRTMKTYILQTENGFFLSNNNIWNHTKSVPDVKEAEKFNYNDAVSFSNLHYQISNTRTRLIEVNSDEFCNLVADSFSQLSEQVYKQDCEIDYESRY
jgi:hypothetical protein